MLQLKQAFQIYNKSLEGISSVEIGNEKSKKKLFRPTSMVRYSNRAINDYTRPLFVFEKCLKVSPNTDAANSHLNSCTGRSKNPSEQEVSKEQKTQTVLTAITKPTKAPKVPKDPMTPKARSRPMISPEPYICMCCNLAFRRKVTYDYHIKEKKRKSSKSSSDESESGSESPQMKKKCNKKFEKDPTFYPNYNLKITKCT